jgi:predicted restriction endonuclease
LAHRIGRTPSAVALKAVNFASRDKQLQARGIRGMSNASKADKALFDEFLAAPEEHLAELLALGDETPESTEKEPQIADDFPSGTDVKVTAVSRRGHAFFRRAVYANFDGRCAMSGLRVPSLLTASHIVPWKAEARLRCDPRNGLLLSALHDRAFDRGLLTVDADLHIVVSAALKKSRADEFCATALAALHGQPLRLPRRIKFLPSREALEYHRDVVFLK